MLVALTLLLLPSVFIHYRGANRQQTWYWNILPISVDVEPARLWDWYDAQFLRDIPQLDVLIPIKPRYQPHTILILQDPAELQASRMAISLFDMRFRLFDWAVAAFPDRAHLDRLGGEAVRDDRVSVTFSTSGLEKGSPYMSEIQLDLTRQGGAAPSARRLVVPIEIRLTRVGQFYLPFIARD